jgi:hypothetical protein
MTDCNVLLQVSRDDEGDGTRRVELAGDDESIEKAQNAIQDILDGKDTSYSGGGGGGGGARGGGGRYGGGGNNRYGGGGGGGGGGYGE